VFSEERDLDHTRTARTQKNAGVAWGDHGEKMGLSNGDGKRHRVGLEEKKGCYTIGRAAPYR